jgi:uncharacterized membrane protein
VKQFATVSFLIFFLLITNFASAQIQYYGIDGFVNSEGKTFVKLTIVFFKPEKEFELKIFAKIENFNASSNAGPVSCNVIKGEASLISCEMNLTQEKRTLNLNFETNDFVKKIDEKYYLSADLSLGKEISSLFASFKLDEGLLISKKDDSPQIFPANATILSDGRRVIVNWNFQNIEKDRTIKFEIFYETIEKTKFPLLFLVLIFSAIAIVSSIFYKRIKKARKLIFSVLDEQERKILDMISKSEQINQKKIVQTMNLSKAKVSRIVKKLAERGLIKVERRGRTNILRIVKKRIEI